MFAQMAGEVDQTNEYLDHIRTLESQIEVLQQALIESLDQNQRLEQQSSTQSLGRQSKQQMAQHTSQMYQNHNENNNNTEPSLDSNLEQKQRINFIGDKQTGAEMNMDVNVDSHHDGQMDANMRMNTGSNLTEQYQEHDSGQKDRLRQEDRNVGDHLLVIDDINDL